MINKITYYIPIFVFIGAFLGSVLGNVYFKNDSYKYVHLMNPLPTCGPEGHPNTGNLVIVLCSED